MMKQIYLCVALVGALMPSLVVANDFSSQQCSNLRSDSNFSISFSISQSTLTETVWADKGVGNGQQEALALWTDNVSVGSGNETVIKRAGSEIIDGEDYQVLLTYDESQYGNKQGELNYYLLEGYQWVEYPPSVFADFTSLNSVNIVI
ncbi:hypothetical protein RCJ22_14165, partial [Vibrio sp. FNV 38]|nr:hypothetical protein [Vibrio sp. FNV 38]